MPLACTGRGNQQPWRITLYLSSFLLYQVLILAQCASCLNVSLAVSPLQLLNPWVSACDLASPTTSPDLQGTCSAIMHQTDNNNNNYNNNNYHSNNNNKYANNNRAISTTTATTVSPNQRRRTGDITEGPGPPTSGANQQLYNCPKECSKESFYSTDRTHHTPQTTYTNTTMNQCLYYLDESHKGKVCGSSGGNIEQRKKLLHKLRLRHCCEHSAAGALSEVALNAVWGGGEQCHVYLGALIELDVLAARVTCEFEEVLLRYDCSREYSVRFHCEDCKTAYRHWVCSSLIPHFSSPGRRVRPCRELCQRVEQRCPYFLPADRAPSYPTQYAGEPTFLCLDPNIPETGGQLASSSYGAPDCCYTVCNGAAQGICTPHNCSQHNNRTQQHQCASPASSAATAADNSGRTVLSACAITNTPLVQVVSSGASRLLIENNCWVLKLLQFYVVKNIMNLLLHILFSLVKGRKRIYVFGYT